ncbi:hypothetical protein [Streptomyces profundus]|uniref:DUF7848 domain-containing protein n=1 Tax=Streptomyces profundus TaxID=2867410 RepID=UPI001D165DFB|nr:hypothetical protein [Streptomyces sp. MA3_2.13]UED84088.1 hypothetical protein K4G22_07595 [Streptomyces sp. MA3_2.13]
MSGEPIIKGADWVLTDEHGPGAPDGIYAVECMACTARSPLFDNDAHPVAVWAINHTQENPDHGLFLARAEKHWRVVRRRHEDESPGPAPQKPVVAFLDRAFGPAFVGLMCLCTALTGYLIALN